MSAETIGFQIRTRSSLWPFEVNLRTGPEAPSKTGASMDIDVRVSAPSQPCIVYIVSGQRNRGVCGEAGSNTRLIGSCAPKELLFNATLRLAHGFKCNP